MPPGPEAADRLSVPARPQTRAQPYAASDYAVDGLYLDAAARHPLPVPAAERLRDYAAFLTRHEGRQGLTDKQRRVRSLFARLIGAEEQEVALLPGTTFGERAVLRALRLPDHRRAIVTDELHYSESVAFYRAAAAAGARVVVLPCRNGGIDHDRLADAIVGGAALVAISSVSHNNGFVHDLRRVCSLAHAHGALVYADVIQHAGALPLDVRATGVDFASCGTYKWLLGDMGAAFFFARRDHWPLFEESVEANWLTAGRSSEDRGGRFSSRTLGAGAVEILLETLPRTRALVSRPDDPERRTILDAIDRAFDAIDLRRLTPAGSPAPIRAYAGDAVTPRAIGAMLSSGLRVTASPGYLRLSPSRFNTLDHVDRTAAIVRRAIERG